MGQIRDYIPVKMFVGMISSEVKLFDESENILRRKFGPIDSKSDIMKFTFTDYYQEEMGKGLLRKFISFEKLIDPGRLAGIKIFTNKLELKTSRKGGSRRINLDPGYITESNLILATTKGFQHRIYLNKGIFAEVTMRYEKGLFKPYDWTYLDFRSEEYIKFFCNLRGSYRRQLGQWKERKNIGA